MLHWGSSNLLRRGDFRAGRVLRSLVAAFVLATLLPMSALAVDPKAGASTFGTGIAAGTTGADNSSVPPAYLKEKNSQFKAFVTTGARPTPRAKQGASARLMDVVLPKSGTGVPTAAYLPWYPGFHQKTSYYCLVAVVQSIAYFDLEPWWYKTLGTGSIKGAQDKLYFGYYDPDGTWNPPLWVGGAVNSGASDAKAMVWINRQFSKHNVDWYYAAGDPANFDYFMAYIRFDVAMSHEPTYVRVDLSTPRGTGYPWYQAARNGVHPEHATLAVGYRDSDGVVRSYDPFTYTNASGRCNLGSFPGPDWACDWNMYADHYFTAMDDIIANPVWW